MEPNNGIEGDGGISLTQAEDLAAALFEELLLKSGSQSAELSPMSIVRADLRSSHGSQILRVEKPPMADQQVRCTEQLTIFVGGSLNAAAWLPS